MANIKEITKTYEEKKKEYDKKVAMFNAQLSALLADMNSIEEDLIGQSEEYINKYREKVQKKIDKVHEKMNKFIEEQKTKIENWMNTQKEKIQKENEEMVQMKTDATKTATKIQAGAILAITTGQTPPEIPIEEIPEAPEIPTDITPETFDEVNYAYSYIKINGIEVFASADDCASKKAYNKSKILTDSDDELKVCKIRRTKYDWYGMIIHFRQEEEYWTSKETQYIEGEDLDDLMSKIPNEFQPLLYKEKAKNYFNKIDNRVFQYEHEHENNRYEVKIERKII